LLISKKYENKNWKFWKKLKILKKIENFEQNENLENLKNEHFERKGNIWQKMKVLKQ